MMTADDSCDLLLSGMAQYDHSGLDSQHTY